MQHAGQDVACELSILNFVLRQIRISEQSAQLLVRREARVIFDKHLQGAEFFDAAKFPTITFVSTSVATEGTNATISGNLTIKGVTKPVVLKARLIGAGKAFWGGKKTNVGFAATTAINRSDFGMGYSVPLVSDRIDLTINAGFEAQ